MAYGMRRSERIRVHQAVHGYSDGHRLLACSTSLKPRDLKTMLVLSDASGPGAAMDEWGYLTGYPLTESGMYALARTWAAHEMPRPGCVWTHTLLIDFADLATLPELGIFGREFRRPSPDGSHPIGYDVALTPEVEGSLPVGHDEHDRALLRRLLWALYGHPSDRVITSEASLEKREALVISIWNQQWPRLRRGFRFCTLAFGDRSIDGTPFDLQFVPAIDRAARTRFKAVDADRLARVEADWLDCAVEDLMRASEGRLRAFFRETGGDVAGGREAFAPLCRLHQLVGEGERRASELEEAFEIFDGPLAPAQARTARVLVVSAAAARAKSLSTRGLDFIIKHLDLLNPVSLTVNAEQVGLALWAHDPASILGMLHDEPPRRIVAEYTVKAVSIQDLLRELQHQPYILATLLALRFDIIEEGAFWGSNVPWEDDAIEILAENPGRIVAAIGGMLASSRVELAKRALHKFGVGIVFEALAAHFEHLPIDEPSGSEAAWVAAVAQDAEAVAKSLSQAKSLARSFLVALARSTHPDHVPNDFGEDPWVTASRTATGEVSERSDFYYRAYLIARALGSRSRNQADLMAMSFESLHSAVLRSQLSEESWQLLEPRLPLSWFWISWDRAARMRSAVVDAFVYRDLAPVVFGRLVQSDDLFAQLVDVASQTWRGREYLKRVMRTLDSEAGNSRRVQIIEDYL